MVYTILIVGALFVLVLALFLLFFLQGRTAKSKEDFSPIAVSNDSALTMQTGNVIPDQTSFTDQMSQQWFDGSNLTDGRTTSRSSSTHVTGAIRGVSPISSSVQGVAYVHSRPGSSPLSLSQHSQPLHRYELEQEYERGMRTLYDERVGTINFIAMHVVMNTPAEVEIAFHVCKRQIRHVLRSKGLERAPTLTDIGGLVIGRDATAAWGQALKQYLEEMCIKVGKDIYLLAHYNSQTQRPNHDELQEKIRRIQFMTSAAINNFQSNIFDTREEAVAFLLRMREVYHV